ncbi:L-lysine exporter family protein LysE/ArgO [Desulforhopalus singaporensis]|uniref:L-lysine exporter family protein LysE/ArgO n=2 Tax=Desulforhopalus singaporensis TaxID=91360 RepID=A0A1H0J4G3_9BACT|nr:L-lysine exporter family protein LysE/ArgO [Desulforhopalus singaporensis]
MIHSFFHGFATSGGLIVAIGAQNAFVLSQSVRGKHYVIISIICICCDVALISVGVAGVGKTVAANPALARWVSWGGALFLFGYGWRSLQSALRGGTLESSEEPVQSLKQAVLMAFAVTLLNPHVYLDTVVLIGAVSSKFQDRTLLLFWLGAVCASFTWFGCLSLGGRVLAPILGNRRSWRILDSLICGVMWTIGVSLVRHGAAV